MTDTKTSKPGRDGDSLMAQFLRHKDKVLEGLTLEDLLKLKPVGTAPTEWKTFLAASQASHKTMDALKEAPESKEAYDAAVTSMDGFAAAARAWSTVATSAPTTPPTAPTSPVDETKDGA